MRTVRIKDLEQVFTRIINKLKEESEEAIELKTNFYSVVLADHWENLDNPRFGIGSLEDDIESVTSLINQEGRPCTYVDFDRIANILHAISQEYNPPEESSGSLDVESQNTDLGIKNVLNKQ